MLLDLRWPFLAVIGLQYQGACHAIEVLGKSTPGLTVGHDIGYVILSTSVANFKSYMCWTVH